MIFCRNILRRRRSRPHTHTHTYTHLYEYAIYMQPNLDKYLRETGSADFKIEKLSDALSIDTIGDLSLYYWAFLRPNRVPSLHDTF